MKFFVAAAAMVAAVAAAPAPEAEAWGTGHCATASATRTASYSHYSYSPTATTHKHEGRRSRLRVRPRRRLSAGGTEGGEHPCGVRPDPLQPSLLQRQQLRVRPAAHLLLHLQQAHRPHLLRPFHLSQRRPLHLP